jgi:hypothetical protein
MHKQTGGRSACRFSCPDAQKSRLMKSGFRWLHVFGMKVFFYFSSGIAIIFPPICTWTVSLNTAFTIPFKEIDEFNANLDFAEFSAMRIPLCFVFEGVLPN